MKTTKDIKKRLEYLRCELRKERISTGELCELQSLTKHIAPGDVELLEAAGVPEFPEVTHTPGQWIVKRGRPLTIEAPTACAELKTTVCRVNQVGEHTEGNAALIAAAPDLLAALELCVDDLRGFQVLTADTAGRQSITAARAAIAKARP